MSETQAYADLLAEKERLHRQLTEATETIEAICTGQVDALVVEGETGHELYTLKTANQSFRVFIETMNEGAVTLGEGGLIVYCNPTFATLVGRPLAQVLGTPLYEFITSDHREQCQILFSETTTGHPKLELTLTGGTGQPIPCLLSVTAMMLDEGTSFSIIVTDLTASQALLWQNNERLERANIALEVSNHALKLSNDNLQQFAYVASHDLQEPLRKIHSFGDLLKSTYAPQLGPDGTDMIIRTGAAANRMSVPISDLLNYSRLTTQQAPFKPVDLMELIPTILDDLSVAVTERGAVVGYTNLPTLTCDPAQLQQLFQNLLSNGLKFQQNGCPPQVRVTARTVPQSDVPNLIATVPDAHQHYHEISVTNNGIGFDEKYLDRIFQVFQRLHGKSNYPGSGVGLAICRKVVTNHLGVLTAHSKPGHGATFVVYLPA